MGLLTSPLVPTVKPDALLSHADRLWEDAILPTLAEYIRIPNRSPLFDPDWERQGYMDEAVALAETWCRRHAPRDARVEVARLPGRTPVLLVEVPGVTEETVLLYGHLDKQPEMTGWREGLGPWTPVREGERLYGRGGADDGYAVFASVAALSALADQRLAHARAVVLIECCEESGSYDLPHYVEALAERIGRPSLVVCLDSGCGSYDRLWCTTSLRGVVSGTLEVGVLTEGVHSGDASGIVPSSFRIARALLDRLEDPVTGTIRPAALHAPIPAGRVAEAGEAAAALGASVHARFPFTPGTAPVSHDPRELILNRTWRPALEVIGAGGLPPLSAAGNVLRPSTALKLSLRLPPSCPPAPALETLRTLLEADPPHGAAVSFTPEQAMGGWDAPRREPWLTDAIARASAAFFGAPPGYLGEGGSIPFIGLLAERFPAAQFVVTGVLGPQSNAHGPNEFLHLPTAKRLTASVAEVLHAHAARGLREAA
jgi:acetylornithine deacetylase/succinyl-diaminopimelate desuccinylase-like protein